MAENGFDVSIFQSGAYAGGGGFSFGFAKLTEGVGFKDAAADRHMAAILSQPIVPGGYHFARPDLNPGQSGAYAEADWFWRVATSYGGARGMLLADDQEVGTGPLGAWRDDFCGRLAWRLGGYNPGWYSYWNFIGTRALNYATNYWAWLAWPDANGALPSPNFAISLQQYGLTTVPGISGQVDANRFFGDVTQLKELTVGGPAPTPAPDPTPPPAPPQEDPDMGDIAYLDVATLGQQQIYWVDAAGQLWERWYGGSPAAWNGPLLLASGLAPRGAVTAKADDGLKQVQLLARMADGRIAHLVCDYGADFSAPEVHGEPDGGPAPVIDPNVVASAVTTAVLAHLPAGVNEAQLVTDLSAALVGSLPAADATAVKAAIAKALGA